MRMRQRSSHESGPSNLLLPGVQLTEGWVVVLRNPSPGSPAGCTSEGCSGVARHSRDTKAGLPVGNAGLFRQEALPNFL